MPKFAAVRRAKAAEEKVADEALAVRQIWTGVGAKHADCIVLFGVAEEVHRRADAAHRDATDGPEAKLALDF